MQDGKTPLLLAAEKGHIDLVKKLAEQYEGDVFRKVKVCVGGFLLHMCKCMTVHTCPTLSPPEFSERPPLGSLQRPPTCPAVPLSHIWRQSA